jgi:Domain of unknown function (DUF4252)
MVKIINYIALLIITLLLAIACTNDSDLQNYFVNHQDDANFVAIDIPSSILGDTDEVSDDVKEAIHSFKKLNILALKKNESNKEVYEKERSNIKKILAKKQYRDLMRFKDGKNMVIIKYLGTETSVNQIIFFGYANDKGLMLVRVLGDKMDVNKALKLVTLARSGKIDTSKIKALEGMFK